MTADPPFSAFDEPTERSNDSYALPLDQWNRAVDAAQWMSNLDTVSPLRRRMKTFLEAGGQVALRDDGDRFSTDSNFRCTE